MLLDLPDWIFGPDCPTTKRIAEIKAEDPDFNFKIHKPLHYETGVYGSFTLEHDLHMAGFKLKWDAFDPAMDHSLSTDERIRLAMEHYKNDGVQAFGVCDHYEQVLKRWPQIQTDSRQFILVVAPITREDNAGWRWHKNGTYIGTQNPRCEYIGDEPEIEKVWMFHIYEVTHIPEATVSV